MLLEGIATRLLLRAALASKAINISLTFGKDARLNVWVVDGENYDFYLFNEDKWEAMQDAAVKEIEAKQKQAA